MKCGGIYIWETAKARGHASRKKIHVYICKDHNDKHVFLFINTKNYYNEGFELQASNYPQSLTHTSYVSCTTPVRYKDSEIAHLKESSPLEYLCEPDIRSLMEHIRNSEILELRDIKLITEALDSVVTRF